MHSVFSFTVSPKIPKELAFLETLANNLWWCWHPDAIALFRRMDTAVWRESGHVPKVFFNKLPKGTFDRLKEDMAFLSHMQRVEDAFNKHVLEAQHPLQPEKNDITAYFSLEFGIHESVRIYSGGLGILAGDHLKSASDMNTPLVGIGLFYKHGYFKQRIDKSGWQLELYPDNDIENLPIKPVEINGDRLVIDVKMENRTCHAQVWQLNVGNIPLYLLDTDLDNNDEDFRMITSSLYGGDNHKRISQELILGVGGFKALVAMDYNVKACHMNEGHAAFLGLARVPHLMKKFNTDYDVAYTIHKSSTVFTTHTPVPAGNESFKYSVLKSFLSGMEGEMGISVDDFLKMGHSPHDASDAPVSMTMLGLRNALYSNGVSKLHGAVARDMWKHLWYDTPVSEVPIDHITNGVHITSWVSSQLSEIFDRYLGQDWENQVHTHKRSNLFDTIPDAELYYAHQAAKMNLVSKVRALLSKQLKDNRVSFADAQYAKYVLDPDALTIGFARRFATYKRATLLLKDKERLLKLIRNKERPVQFVFSGKAHPADNFGKHFIQEVIKFAEENDVRDKFVFAENYDINIARQLVQGVDVWLNNPIRPEEASGTSGMKAAANGAINLSILDGWWAEGYSTETGWVIESAADDITDREYRDTIESQNLLAVLENEVVPMYYDRTTDDLPYKWIAKMKGTIRMALEDYSSHRMVSDYVEKFYKKAMSNYDENTKNDCANAKSLLKNKLRVKHGFQKVHVGYIDSGSKLSNEMHTGDHFDARVEVYLDDLKPADVNVQLYMVNDTSHGEDVLGMKLEKELGDNKYLYGCKVDLEQPGRYSITSRVIPSFGEGTMSLLPGSIKWSS